MPIAKIVARPLTCGFVGSISGSMVVVLSYRLALPLFENLKENGLESK